MIQIVHSFVFILYYEAALLKTITIDDSIFVELGYVTLFFKQIETTQL